MAVIGAILWAQWKSSKLLRFGGGRRGAIFSMITSALWYGVWVVAAVGVGAFTSEAAARADIERFFPAILIFILLYWQLAPILVASLGAALDLRKLLAYPIPPEKLFQVEVMLRVTTGVETLLLISGAAIGLIRNPEFGGWARMPRVLAPLLVFVLFNLLLATGLRGLIERLLGQKRLREVFVLLLVTMTALPRILLVGRVPRARALRILTEDAPVACPWVAVSRLSLSGAAIAPWVALVAWTAAAYVFARWQFQSNLLYDFEAAEATRRSGGQPEDSWGSKLVRLPSALLPDPVGALVEKELRTLARAPRFRLVFIMGFTFGLLVWIPIIFGRGHDLHTAVVGNFLTVLCFYALALLGQVTYWNSFGFDRSAVQAYFAWPAPISRALIGKNLAAGIFVFLEMAAVTTACLLLRITPSPEKILEAFLMTPIVAIFLFAAGNICSVYMPRPLTAERTAQGRSAGQSQAFMLVMYPLALAPAALAYGARYAFHSQLAFYLMLVFDAALGAIVYWLALDSASKAADEKREQIIDALSRGDGPVMAE